MPRYEPILTSQAVAASALPGLRAPPRLRRSQRPRRTWRRRRPALVISIVVHVAAIAILLFLPKLRPPETVTPPGMQMVFEPGVQQPTQMPGPEPVPAAPLAAPTPPRQEPPHELIPLPPPPPPPEPPVAAAPPAPPPAATPVKPAPLAAQPAPTEPLPPPPPLPSATEALPPPPRAARPAPQHPAPLRTATARPAPPPRPAPPARSASAAFPRPTFQALGNVFGGAIEGTRSLRQAGGGLMQPFRQTAGAPVGDAWLERFREWVETHKYYPEQAAQLGQEGMVGVEIHIAPDGRVTDLELRQRSGSPWLDLGLQAIFRDAQVPPLPPSSGNSGATFRVTMTYQLIR